MTLRRAVGEAVSQQCNCFKTLLIIYSIPSPIRGIYLNENKSTLPAQMSKYYNSLQGTNYFKGTL